MNEKLEVERKMCLIYPFNPNTTVVANIQRNLYLASLLGVKNVKFYPVYKDTKDSTIDKSFDIVDKLVSTSLELGYDEALPHGFFKGIGGFSPKIFYYNEEKRMYDGYVNLDEYIDNNSSALENRESVGKRLIKRKNNSVNSK